MTDDEIKYTIALSKHKGIGLLASKKMIFTLGSAEKIFSSRKVDLIQISGISPKMLENFPSKEAIDIASKEVIFMKNNGIRFLRFDSIEYPFLLKQLHDAPIYIMTKGDSHIDRSKLISIVGTRNMTNYGRKFCEDLIEELSPYNPTIVSGLAYGVDITAHRQALKHKLQNFAVVAHGLDQIYPKIHFNEAKKIMENGGLISEYTSGVPPNRENFPQRNRIIAGISNTTIIIEAKKKGGALITAELANDYNRDVFALPGRVGDPYSEGCNNLIKQDKAILLNSPEDLIKYLGWNEKNKPAIQKTLFVETTEQEDIVLQALSKEDLEIDFLAQKTKMPVYKLSPILLDLELKGLVQPMPGKIFKII